MVEDWNKARFFSSITKDYSNHRWYNGEDENPYTNGNEKPLAARLWEYERNFHFAYLSMKSNKPLKEAYQQWKVSFIHDYLPSKSANPYGDKTDWGKCLKQEKESLYREVMIHVVVNLALQRSSITSSSLKKPFMY